MFNHHLLLYSKLALEWVIHWIYKLLSINGRKPCQAEGVHACLEWKQSWNSHLTWSKPQSIPIVQRMILTNYMFSGISELQPRSVSWSARWLVGFCYEFHWFEGFRWICGPITQRYTHEICKDTILLCQSSWAIIIFSVRAGKGFLRERRFCVQKKKVQIRWILVSVWSLYFCAAEEGENIAAN